MKKITFLLTLLSVLSMTACDKANDQAAAEKPVVDATTIETTESNTAIENAAGLSETPATPVAETTADTTDAVKAEVPAEAAKEEAPVEVAKEEAVK